jgi:uncharacterized membrane protein
MPRQATNGRLERLAQPGIASVVERNIKSIEKHRRDAENARTFQERIADAITRISGSLTFVLLHVVWFGVWVAANVGFFGIEPFDPFPFGLLTTIVSLEAIFLSTFVLVSQNRQSEIADRRAQLDLQINLLAEYEITRLLKLQDAMAKHAGIEEVDSDEMNELENDVEPEAVLEKLESEEEKSQKQGNQESNLKRKSNPKMSKEKSNAEEVVKTGAHRSQG